MFRGSGEVIGAKLAAKYSAKELAGRVQQLQLLIREKEMKLEPEMQQKLWNQLEAEINLHRHKTIIRECRYASLHFIVIRSKLLQRSPYP